MSLRIEHTESDGTLLVGTSRGDGASEVVKALGWRWGRTLGLWFVPRSRNVAPKRALISQTADRLRDNGFEVIVAIDTTVGDRQEAEDARTARAVERAERLTERSVAEQARADARYAAAKEITRGIPFGQPILVGHHSQRRAERDAARIHRHMDASVEHQRRANHAADAARTAAAGPGARHNPVTVGNRIERLAAEIRKDERELTRHTAAGGDPASGWRVAIEDRLAIARADLAYWTQVRAEQIAAGEATDYSRDTVAVGDLVKIRGQWRIVARCNVKTVAVQTGYSWTDKAPWYEVQAHRRPVRQAEDGGQS